MKNLKPLSKAEMKKVVGGNSNALCGPQNGNATCPSGECCSDFGYCGSSVEYCGDDYPKINACIGKKEGDYCVYSLQGTPYDGYCRYLLGPLHCSNVI